MGSLGFKQARNLAVYLEVLAADLDFQAQQSCGQKCVCGFDMLFGPLESSSGPFCRVLCSLHSSYFFISCPLSIA